MRSTLTQDAPGFCSTIAAWQSCSSAPQQHRRPRPLPLLLAATPVALLCIIKVPMALAGQRPAPAAITGLLHHRLDLALTSWPSLRTGAEQTNSSSTSSQGLCHAKRADEALEVLLHRIAELGCIPDVVAYNMVHP
ncbi:hypothetical protein ZWY2020_057722 [Hordeum vulgare]|nr:hypothetical protein ZWY2020_057722 [Hordeum vulgare]